MVSGILGQQVHRQRRCSAKRHERHNYASPQRPGRLTCTCPRSCAYSNPTLVRALAVRFWLRRRWWSGCSIWRMWSRAPQPARPCGPSRFRLGQQAPRCAALAMLRGCDFQQPMRAGANDPLLDGRKPGGARPPTPAGRRRLSSRAASRAVAARACDVASLRVRRAAAGSAWPAGGGARDSGRAAAAGETWPKAWRRLPCVPLRAALA
jgi:hypothetical protein